MSEKTIPIPGRLKNVAIGGHVAGSEDIDAGEGKTQKQVNDETNNTLALHQSEISGLNSQNYVSVSSYSSLPATGSADTIYRVSSWDGNANSGEGAADVTKYTEYAWNGTAYIVVSVKTQVGEVFDISQYKAVGGTLAKFADLSAALDSGNNVPAGIRKGGMSIKYIQSSDNKYVQYRLMSDSFNTTVDNWQGVDDEPTPGSDNLVKSGGVYYQIQQEVNNFKNYLVAKLEVGGNISGTIEVNAEKDEQLTLKFSDNCKDVFNYLSIEDGHGNKLVTVTDFTQPYKLTAPYILDMLQFYASSLKSDFPDGNIKIEVCGIGLNDKIETADEQISELTEDLEATNENVDEITQKIIGKEYIFEQNLEQKLSYIFDCAIKEGEKCKLTFSDSCKNVFNYLGVYNYETGTQLLNITSFNSNIEFIAPSNISKLQYYVSSLKAPGNVVINFTVNNGIESQTSLIPDICADIAFNKISALTIVTPTQTKSEFCYAINYYNHVTFANFLGVNADSLPNIDDSKEWADIYEDINKNFRCEVCKEGMSHALICDRINYQFTQHIYRFMDAKPNPASGIDWSIIPIGEIAGDNDEPSLVVSNNGVLQLYSHLKLYESYDGINFGQGVQCVLDRYLMHVNINLINGVYYLLGSNADNQPLVLCTSVDGINFTFRGNIFLNGMQITDNLKADKFGNSYLTKIDGKWYLYYEIQDDDSYQGGWCVCVATCTDLFYQNTDGTIGNWDNYQGNPILPNMVGEYRYSSGNPELARGEDNMPIKVNGKYYMYFHGAYGTWQTTAAIYRAYSTNLLDWTIEGATLDCRDITKYARGDNADQSIIEYKGKSIMAYTFNINHAPEVPYIKLLIDNRPMREILKLMP